MRGLAWPGWDQLGRGKKGEEGHGLGGLVIGPPGARTRHGADWLGSDRTGLGRRGNEMPGSGRIGGHRNGTVSRQGNGAVSPLCVVW